MKKIIIAAVLLLVLCGCGNSQSAESFEAKKVTCAEKDKVLKDKKAMLIDVRTEEEFNTKHLANAINIPFDKIVDTLKTYGTIDFNVPLIVYCKSGGRSGQAAASLIKEGYKKVYDLGAMSNCE